MEEEPLSVLLNEVKLRKKAANELFKKNLFEEAAKIYEPIADEVSRDRLHSLPYPQDVGESKLLLRDFQKESISVCSNLSLVHFKLKNFDKGVEYATRGIDEIRNFDPDKRTFKGKRRMKIKLYYRRYCCYKGLNNFVEALAQLNSLLKIEPENATFLKLKKEIWKSWKSGKNSNNFIDGMKKKNLSSASRKALRFFQGYGEDRETQENQEKMAAKKKLMDEKRREERQKERKMKKTLHEEAARRKKLSEKAEEILPDFSALFEDVIVHILSFYRMEFGPNSEKFSTDMKSFFGYFKVDESRRPFCLFSNFVFTPEVCGSHSLKFIPMQKCRGLNFNKYPPDLLFSRRVFPHLCAVHSLEYVVLTLPLLQALQERNAESLQRLNVTKLIPNEITDEVIGSLNKFRRLRHLTLGSKRSPVVIKKMCQPGKLGGINHFDEEKRLDLGRLRLLSVREKTLQETLRFREKIDFSNWNISELNNTRPSILQRLSHNSTDAIVELHYGGDLTFTNVRVICSMVNVQKITILPMSIVSSSYFDLLLKIPTLRSLTLSGFHTMYRERGEHYKDKLSDGNYNLGEMEKLARGSRVEEVHLCNAAVTPEQLELLARMSKLRTLQIVGQNIVTEHMNRLWQVERMEKMKIVFQDVTFNQTTHQVQGGNLGNLELLYRDLENYVHCKMSNLKCFEIIVE